MADQQQQTIDLETIPFEELRALAEKEAADAAAAAANQQPNADQKKDQPRGEDGKFKSKQDAAPKEEEQKQDEQNDDDQEVTVYRREVKNADGSVDVYEDETLEGLLDKIAEGKENANQKIRQQELELKELRARTAEKPKAKEVSADDEYVYSQEMMKTPTVAFKKMFKELTGRDIEDFGTIAQRMDAVAQAEKNSLTVDTFLATHTDYEDTPKNSAAMKLALQGTAMNGDDFHKAYLHLKKSRLLDLKGEEAHADTNGKTKEAEPTVQAKVETTQQRTRKGSGVSTQSRTATPKPTTELSEDEIAKLSDDQLRDLANKQLAAQQS